MHRPTLLARRADHLDAADKMTREAMDAGRDLTAAQKKELNEHMDAIKEIDATIAHADKLSGIDPNKRNPGNMFGLPDASQVNGNGWVDPRSGRPVAVLAPEQRMADLVDPMAYGEGPLSMGKTVKGVATGNWKGAEREFRAMSEGSGGAGQFLVALPLSAQVIDKVRNRSVMLKAGALTIPMDAQTLSIARIAGDVSPAWHTEAAAITASDMTFEQVKFTAQTLVAICQCSVEVFEDASNLDQIVSDAIAKVLAIELDRACLRGSGTLPEIKGIRNQSNVTVDSTTFTTNGSAISTTTPTGAVAWDWLSKQVSGLWGVNENPNAAIYSARTAGELDLLRASTGEVLPPPGSVSKLQLLYTNSIPNNLNSDCSEAYVGDFSQAVIGMRRELMLEVSRTATVGSTSMFSTMQVAIRAYLRADFQLARPGAFRVVTGIR